MRSHYAISRPLAKPQSVRRVISVRDKRAPMIRVVFATAPAAVRQCVAASRCRLQRLLMPLPNSC